MYTLFLKISAILLILVCFSSCSKDVELSFVYPNFNATINYDSTSVKFPNRQSSMGGHFVGKELTGCLRKSNGQEFCIQLFFDSLVSSFDLKDSLEGKVFYFTSGKNYPTIILSHSLDDQDYNTFRTQEDVGGDYFVQITKVEALPGSSKIFNTKYIPWAVTGIFKARMRNASGRYENTTGDFLMLMEYIEAL